jgi:DNA-binding CsgD family transcriptional regulator/PAS domain-containing protein
MGAIRLVDRNGSRATAAIDDELVELIYRGPLEARPWHGFLDALADRLGCLNAGIVLRLSRQGTPPIAIWGRPPAVSDAEARRIQATHAEIGHLDPLRNALSAPGAIHTLDEIMPRAALLENRFYREVLAPYGFERMLGMYIAEPGGWEGNIGVVNPLDRPDFGDAHRQLLLGLRRHIEQSLAIFARISREETELQALIDTLDRLTIGTFILGADGTVVRANSAARRLLAAREIVLQRDDRLALPDRAADAELQEILSAVRACPRARGAPPFVEAMRVESIAERHVGILVRAIDSPAPYRGGAAPSAVVYVSAARSTQPLERLVMQLFDLTPSEAHLATLLATGFSLAQAAEKLGLTENTVRTYCKTILSKVGVGRQADLIGLILRSVAVLG